ncbi:MAG: 3-hydroxyacyl-CoA dehydrogenase family protein, partial [Bacteroidota bacterium]
MQAFENCALIIEAIVEDLGIKQKVFQKIEDIVSEDCVLATNTSSLSVTAIASACHKPERVMGIHFFNPPPLMALVEIIPAVQSNEAIITNTRAEINRWGKLTVLTKDTPGFIVNRVARPFYGEALRLAEEGIADYATIDWAMKTLGGFRMGPFELMDYIGNDVNYKVTCSVWEAFYYDPRYKPSFLQKERVDANYLGRKSGKGYYDYSEDAIAQNPTEDESLGNEILSRIIVMLINEAADAVYLKIASAKDIELAMTKGVNYPKGLLSWANEIGIVECVEHLDDLHDYYREDRYRCSPLLRMMADEGKQFEV